MPKPIVGLHHVTTIASDPQRNLDFYTGVLGLRLVKKTINFDDPGTYHLYFGDDAGSPGTILTFFPWPHATRGSMGAGETAATAFTISDGSLPFWKDRLRSLSVELEEASSFDRPVLRFSDPDGMRLELVEAARQGAPHPSRSSDVPANLAIHGFHGVTLLVREEAPTAAVLKRMGYTRLGEEGNTVRYSASSGELGEFVDLALDASSGRGRMGAGTVHHIAFRAADDASQRDWRGRLAEHPLEVTSVLDRTYFHSIYFREPGGVLFELATDPPGFTSDEPLDSLGSSLKLPPWLEPRRSALVRVLPPLELQVLHDS